ncbi:MAG: hypothetical protein AAFN13_16285, partial [Bacteroidota bacterium]
MSSFTAAPFTVAPPHAKTGGGIAAALDAAVAPAHLLDPRPSTLDPRPRVRRYDYLIVGAGLTGSVLAERLASQLGKRVL